MITRACSVRSWLSTELLRARLRFCSAMEDASTYRRYADECRKLARSMPEQRARLLDMAAVWLELAARADAGKDDKSK